MTSTLGKLVIRYSAFDGPARWSLWVGLFAIGGAAFWAGGSGAALIAAGLAGVIALGAVTPPRPAVTTEAIKPTTTAPDKLASLIDVLRDPILISVSGQIVAANPAARELLGQHIVGESIRTALRNPLAAEHLDGPMPADPIELGRLGGRDMLWEMNAGTMSDGRRLIHLVDRTQRSALERARTDFVANASHELRTPLTAILGFVETLLDDHTGGDRATRTRFLGVIQSEARRMQTLIADLMSLSRIEANKHHRPTAPVDLGALVRQAIDESRNADGQRRENISFAADTGTFEVLGDRAQLLQVVNNLLDNTHKYGRQDGKVVVTLSALDAKRVVLRVVDQGEGIAAEHLPRVTERFYRVDPGRSRGGGGTGLGLAIVKHIVERHRGRLEIASTVGVGTTVSVVLRARPPAN